MKTIKNLLATAVLLLCSVVAMAQTTATVNGITYEFITKAKLATVVKSASGSYSGNIVIPEIVGYDEVAYSVTAIGEDAFYLCTGLTSITIPNSVTTIGGVAFRNCTGLTSVTIPNSVTTIGYDAFYLCTGLTSITIPNSVTTIGGGAFYGCNGLTSIVVESGNTNYDSREGCNAIIETATNTLITGCKNTVIPGSVTTIRYEAFAECYGLTGITIPNSVTTIGVNAFLQCTGLTSVTIGNSVTKIESDVFRNCTGLTSIYLTGDLPPTADNWNFTDTQYKNVVLYVPKGTLATYQAADVWKEFKNIREFDTTGIEDVVANDACNGRPNTYYNLRGQAVEHPTQGIYIYNGKKQFVK